MATLSHRIGFVEASLAAVRQMAAAIKKQLSTPMESRFGAQMSAKRKRSLSRVVLQGKRQICPSPRLPPRADERNGPSGRKGRFTGYQPNNQASIGQIFADARDRSLGRRVRRRNKERHSGGRFGAAILVRVAAERNDPPVGGENERAVLRSRVSSIATRRTQMLGAALEARNKKRHVRENKLHRCKIPSRALSLMAHRHHCADLALGLFSKSPRAYRRRSRRC
jgi:hypothetical protein